VIFVRITSGLDGQNYVTHAATQEKALAWFGDVIRDIKAKAADASWVPGQLCVIEQWDERK
jgi:hypothetical protein